MKAAFRTGAVIVAALSLCACGTSDLTPDQAAEDLNSLISSNTIKYQTVSHDPDPSWYGVNDPASELPPIDTTYPLSVRGDAPINVEIFASTEKSAAAGNRWFDVMAKDFNASNPTIDGRRVSVSIRPIASGLALSYITSGVHVPEAYSPANNLWAAMIQSQGIQVTQIEQRLAGNTAGILMKQAAYDKYIAQYGSVTMANVVKAVMDGNLRLGHTDPNSSSTGLNILTQELLAMDPANPVSADAASQFSQFQSHIPPASPTTDEMAKVAARGSIDAMTMESQAYMAEPSLQTGWVFTPLGVRHDSPLYGLGAISPDQQQALRMFADWCLQPDSQASATSFHFNLHDDYTYTGPTLTGDQLYAALQLWKQNKDAGKPVLSVFVVDRSGSMAGEPLNQAKLAMTRSIININQVNYIGLVSFSSDDNITVDLPIAQFSNDQQDLFAGAVRDLSAGGNTATNSAILLAAKLLLDKQTDVPNAIERILVFTDGAQNAGLGLARTAKIIKGLGISVYGVGFNLANDQSLADLQSLASLNEGGYCINADNDVVVSQLKSLFQSAL